MTLFLTKRQRSTMYQLPPTGFLRLSQIIGNRKSISPLIPVCKSTWWQGIKTGRFPMPVKLGPRTTAWRVEDIRDLIENGFRAQAHGDRNEM